MDTRPDRNGPVQGRHLYYGLIPAFVALPVALLLLIERRHVEADVVIAGLAVVLAVEGTGLLSNWHGETDAIVEILEGEENPSLLSLMPPIGFRALGLAFLAISVGLIVDAVRFAAA